MTQVHHCHTELSEVGTPGSHFDYSEVAYSCDITLLLLVAILLYITVDTYMCMCVNLFLLHIKAYSCIFI